MLPNELSKLCQPVQPHVILGDLGAASHDGAIFSGESLVQEQKSPWALIRRNSSTECSNSVPFRPVRPNQTNPVGVQLFNMVNLYGRWTRE